jgi:hypothetical protein
LPSDFSRDEIIQKQLDCVTRNLKNNAIGWQDMCVMPDNSTQDQSSDKAMAVDQQLDMFEKNPVHPDMESAGSSFKDLLNPDLNPNPPPKTPSNVKTRMNTLDGGTEIYYYRYDEPTPGEGVKIHGPMYGYYADYDYRPGPSSILDNLIANVYSLQARYGTSHDLEYNGSGIVKGKYDDDWELRGAIGKDYFIGANSRVTPYFGFGYRFLFDRGNGELSSINDYGYDRKSHYYYLPLGGNAVMELPGNWEIGTNIEYDFFIYGLQKSYLSDGDQFNGLNNPNITNDQNQGFGMRISIKLLKRWPLFDLYVEPYIRFWDIEQSEAVTAVIDGKLQTGVEPKNNTMEVGSKFGIQF